MIQEATISETNVAMNNNRYAMDDKLHIVFEYRPGIDKTKSEEAGHPVHKDVLWILLTPPGGDTRERPVDSIDKVRFAQRIAQFEATQGESDGIEGFRLEEWPQITRAQAENLKYRKIYTVEQLAETPDGNLQNVMGGMGLKQKAAEYLEKTTGAEAQLAAMAKRIEELEAQAEKPRRGRPKKVEEE